MYAVIVKARCKHNPKQQGNGLIQDTEAIIKTQANGQGKTMSMTIKLRQAP